MFPPVLKVDPATGQNAYRKGSSVSRNPSLEGRAKAKPTKTADFRLLYAWDRALPTTETDAEQALSTIAALSRRGIEGCKATPPDLDAIHRDYQVEGSFALEYAAAPLARWTVSRKLFHAWNVVHHPELAKVDVVYTRNSATCALALQRGLPVIYDTYRAWPSHIPLARPFVRHLMSRPNFLGAILHSDYARESYLRLGIDSERLLVVRNGYDPSRFAPTLGRSEARRMLGLPQDRAIVTYTGHINLLKGLRPVLAMAARCPEVLFLLVGSTGEGAIERSARKMSNVQVLPWQKYSQVVRYLYASDVLLIPPSSVPLRLIGHTVLPMKIYNYLAAGRPILAPSTPDVRELLKDGENAVLVPPGEPQAAALALQDLLHDEVHSSRLASAAAQTARGLTWDARAANIEAFVGARLQKWRASTGGSAIHRG